MKKFELVLKGSHRIVCADKYMLLDDFLSFYIKGNCVATARLSGGDGVFEMLERKPADAQVAQT